MRSLTRVVAIGTIAAGLWSASANAIALRDGFGGPEGFGELSQGRNDDGSSNRLNLPFAINFFRDPNNPATWFDDFFINNNGNITFNSALGTFTPTAFPVTNQPMIAPYWGDVDTRCSTCGAVYVASPNADTVVATWHNVGFFSSNPSKLNDFQLTLINRSDTGAGNFDIEFRYRQLQWTTGNASGGVNGLGGTPAQAGFDAGDNANFFTLPGSRTANVLNLQNTSNVSLDTPGLWVLPIRNGDIVDGTTPETPFVPIVVNQNGWVFNFGVVINQRVFIDPLVAIGYDYIVDSGPNFQTVVLPTIVGDTDGYDIFGFNVGTGLFDIFLGHVNPGDVFDFGLGGVSRFGVRDIDVDLDPNNTLAFVTGLTFVGDGQVSMRQVPFTVDRPDTQVPEPMTLSLLGGGLAALAVLRRRRRAH